MLKKGRGLTLHDRILQVDHIQARRFSKLEGDAKEIAIQGIVRHIRACARMEIKPDASAIREIIDDALNGRRVFAESNDDTAEVSRTHSHLGNGVRF